MFSKFKPINDGVLVSLVAKESATAGGIIIPDQSQEKSQIALVVHVGKSDQLAVGDKVFCKKYTGHMLDEVYMVIREEDILGVMHND